MMSVEEIVQISGELREVLTFPDVITEKQMDSKSEPNSRSGSFKRKTYSSNILDEDRRRNSLPVSTEQALFLPYHDVTDHKRGPPKRIRSFKISSKGIAKATGGDRRESNASIHSIQDMYRKRLSSENSVDSAICCSCSSSTNDYFRVCIMGANAVGKKTLLNQFMCSERMCSNVFDIGEVEDNMLTVVVDNEESTLEFVDFTEYEDDRYPVDGFIVVFSVHERATYDVALMYLQCVRNEWFSDRPIVLVANKVDLVRKRQVSAEEAKQLAAKYNCKYIETSATLNLQVDQLLVGVLKQIKIKLNPDLKDDGLASREACSKGAKGFLNKVFHLRSKDRHNHDEVLEI